MVFHVKPISLAEAELVPAYDLAADQSFFAFRTPRVPGVRILKGSATVFVYHTYKVRIADDSDPPYETWYYCNSQEYERLYRIYMEGTQNV